MKKIILLLFCLITPQLLLSVEEKTRKQQIHDFLKTNPKIIAAGGALVGGVSVKVFFYDGLKKTVEDLKVKNNDLTKENKEYKAKEKDMLSLASGFYFYFEIKKHNGIIDTLQKIGEAQKELMELTNTNDTSIILSIRDSNSLEALNKLNELKDTLTAYNTIVAKFGGTKIEFKDYEKNNMQGLIFTGLVSESSSQPEQSIAPVLPNPQQTTNKPPIIIDSTILMGRGVDELVQKERSLNNYIAEWLKSVTNIKLSRDMSTNKIWLESDGTQDASNTLIALKTDLDAYNAYLESQSKPIYEFNCIRDKDTRLIKIDFISNISQLQ